MPLVCDTGPILAGLDRDDPDHYACRSLIGGTREDLLVPGLVLAEIDYWCRKLRLRAAWVAFLQDTEEGAWTIVWPSSSDLSRAHSLIERYADLDLGIVDATVIALAERLGEHKVATLDHRHFSVVRPAHRPAFTLLPDR